MSQALRATEVDRAALAEVLARPEFQARAIDATALRRLLSDLWERLLEALGTAEAERYAALGRAVFLAAVAVAGLLVWRAARRRGQARARRAEGSPGPARPSPPAAAPDPGAAAAALASGDLPGAVRLAYGAAAGALGRRGLPSAGQALTGPELAARVGDAGFLALARLHERTVFGRRPVSEPEARQAVEAARRLAAPAEADR